MDKTKKLGKERLERMVIALLPLNNTSLEMLDEENLIKIAANILYTIDIYDQDGDE